MDKKFQKLARASTAQHILCVVSNTTGTVQYTSETRKIPVNRSCPSSALSMAALANRMKREFELLQNDPPHGVGAWPSGDSMTKLESSMTGPEDSPFAGGTFRLSVEVTQRYPFEAPKIRFLTKIYHPNIDTGGRICLDTLKMPPHGTWVPSMNISTTLQHIRLLMATPNADDGLMPEITAQYKSNRRLFEKTAKEWTARHAMSSPTTSISSAGAPSTASNDATTAGTSSLSSSSSSSAPAPASAASNQKRIFEATKSDDSERAPKRMKEEEPASEESSSESEEESEEEESEEEA